MDRANKSFEALQTENERLRERVAELERATVERGPDRQEADARAEHASAPIPGPDAGPSVKGAPIDRAALLDLVLDSAPVAIYLKDESGRYRIGNSFFAKLLNVPQEHLEGKTDRDVLPLELVAIYEETDRQAVESGVITVDDIFPVNGEMVHWTTTKFPVRDHDGRLVGVCGFTIEVTALTRAREENKRLQEELIHAQAESLRALSTPLLPIARGVVVMPLIGGIDRERADRVLDTLLRGITEHRAAIVILDITGVPLVDAAIANTLVQAARAVELLGAEVVLTGVRPQIAHTLVALDAALRGITIKGTLQSGVAYALGRGS